MMTDAPVRVADRRGLSFRGGIGAGADRSPGCRSGQPSSRDTCPEHQAAAGLLPAVVCGIASDRWARWFRDIGRALRNWSYEPFLREGKPVTATFTEYVKIVPPERRPAKHVAFPKIRDWNSLRITLQRSGCFGTCPAYSIHVHGRRHRSLHRAGVRPAVRQLDGRDLTRFRSPACRRVSQDRLFLAVFLVHEREQ